MAIMKVANFNALSEDISHGEAHRQLRWPIEGDKSLRIDVKITSAGVWREEELWVQRSYRAALSVLCATRGRVVSPGAPGDDDGYTAYTCQNCCTRYYQGEVPRFLVCSRLRIGPGSREACAQCAYDHGEDASECCVWAYSVDTCRAEDSMARQRTPRADRWDSFDSETDEDEDMTNYTSDEDDSSDDDGDGNEDEVDQEDEDTL
ncbi:hypothetical protein Micbo1qcDRAFT_210104 [Microdochium bolleyi]|uniref:Uncharacterized protein n=1 Tax=Microdochium bolleyi TaxID=196109 RepID=A0A136IK69_9PEZI|nr:hypothetical protein Micbo1qcDRAFT_210104 [Microdochium bolleyi]